MKRLLYALPLLLILPIMCFGLYDDFSGYESYYKVLDSGTTLTPGGGGTWAATATTIATNLTIGTGSTGVSTLVFNKNAGLNSAEIFGNSLYTGLDLSGISGLNAGQCTFFLSVSSVVGAAGKAVTGVSYQLTSATNITSADSTNSFLGSTSLSITTGTTGFTYIRGGANYNVIDYANMKSARFVLLTDVAGTTVTGVQYADVRYISKDNTTGGAWNEGSGIWEIFKTGGDTVYCQLDTAGSGVTNSPQLFSKTDYKDFIYSAKFKVLTDTTSAETGLMFRNYLGTYYKLIVDPTPTNISITTMTLKKGVATLSATTLTTSAFNVDTDATTMTGNSFWLKAEVKDGRIRGYYATKAAPTTWVPVIDYTDTNPILSGNVGVVGDKTMALDTVTVIPIPAYPSASGGDGHIKLLWSTGYSYSGEVLKYNIYKSTTPGVYGAAYTNATGFSYDDTTVNNGTTYYYKITAVIQTGSTTEEVPLTLTSEVSATPHPGVQVANNPFMPNSASSAKNKVKFTVYNVTSAPVVLKVYQPSGVLVKTVNGTGVDIYWDGTNTGGGIVEGGIYTFQITVDNVVAGSGTVILAK